MEDKFLHPGTKEIDRLNTEKEKELEEDNFKKDIKIKEIQENITRLHEETRRLKIKLEYETKVGPKEEYIFLFHKIRLNSLK